MRVWYGGYGFPDNAVFWSRDESLVIENKIPFARELTVDLTGTLFAATPALLAVETMRLTQALRTPYLPLVLRDSTGASLELLTSEGSTTGVLCVRGPTFDKQDPGQYTTYRSFSAQFKCEYPIQAAMPPMLEWSQSLKTSGGFQKIVWQESTNGPPRKVITCPQTTFKAIQSGRAIGLLFRPSIPPPIFGAAHLMDNPDIDKASPNRVGQGVRDFAIAWEYRYESATPLIGDPGIPP